jgi:hypothetical protein
LGLQCLPIICLTKHNASVVESVDTTDLKSVACIGLRVQVPPLVPEQGKKKW